MVKVRDVIFGILIFAVVSGLLFSYWSDLGTNYDTQEYSNYTGYYDNVSSSRNSAENISQDMQKVAKGGIGFETAGGIKDVVVAAFKLPINALSTSTTLITQTINAAGLPGDEIAMVAGVIIAIIVLMIIWALLSAFFGRVS